ncbi:MAG: cell division protein ZapA [Alphaproteobacteria bacterium]|jgi:cell division protein ZapA|nr:cell division protein ZapA [Alphaproteobacteria bacterium]
MATVNVTINARQYRMACEDGQEQHLLRLAENLDARIAKLHESFGEVGDTRLTVMAALTLADELAESAKRIRRLEEELAGLQDARVVSADRAQATQAAIASAFNSAAERVENLAKSLNQGLGDGGVAMG